MTERADELRSRAPRTPNSKTGCATCKIRKIKCDQAKPKCKKCLNTGRNCDGYQSPFRSISGGPEKQSAITRAGTISPLVVQPEISASEVETLNRLFSTKTMFDVKVDCLPEAERTLRASLHSPFLRRAISALRDLRADLESPKPHDRSTLWRSSSNDHSHDQYSLALQGVVGELAGQNEAQVSSILLCCQLFISIEQVRGDYRAMMQHLLQGLAIMRAYGARPSIDHRGTVRPANPERLPQLDVFVIKLFVAPCLFEKSPISTLPSEKPEQDACRSRPLAPDIRQQLTKISTSVLDFLDQICNMSTVCEVQQLVVEKMALLNSLDEWTRCFEEMRGQQEPGMAESLSMLFLRLFHQVLRVVLAGALSSLPSLEEQAIGENVVLLSIADVVGRRVQEYTAVWRGIQSGQ